MLNSGELYALDHSRKKVNELNALLQSLGYTCAKALYADAATDGACLGLSALEVVEAGGSKGRTQEAASA